MILIRSKQFIPTKRFLILFLNFFFFLVVTAALAQDRLLVGTEYILLDNKSKIARQANVMAEAGIISAKHYVESVQWDMMQPTETSAINFEKLDHFVREFQNKGFTDLLICLKSVHKIFSKSSFSNYTPQPQYETLYEQWVKGIVERYDYDGIADMEGLKYPVKYIEIGNEFSTYEPEPVGDYLHMLEIAYQAAHEAYDGPGELKVAHAAFLLLDVFRNNPSPSEYEEAFVESQVLAMNPHGLADIRQVLSRPDIFDILNVHALGDFRELEQMVKFLKHETAHYAESKPIIISDTSTSSFIAFGAADSCVKKEGDPFNLGIMLYPARESDRCSLADYFQNLINKDPQTLKWVYAFAAEDTAKKIISSAERDSLAERDPSASLEIKMIQTSFTTDLFWQIQPFWYAATGNTAWSGQIDISKPIAIRRPGFFAMKQVMEFLGNYDEIIKLAPNEEMKGTAYENIYLYEIHKAGVASSWVIWYEPPYDEGAGLYFYGKEVPKLIVPLAPGEITFKAKPLITAVDNVTNKPIEEELIWKADQFGIVNIELSPTPIFVMLNL